MNDNRYYDRIDYIDNIDNLSRKVCEEYKLGDLLNTKVIEIGYEDFNMIINTSTGKYFVKVFANYRSDEEVNDVIERAYVANNNGVKSPKVYLNTKGNIVTNIRINDSKFRLSLMEYIDGKNFFELNRKATDEELIKIADLASEFGNIDYKPKYIYDSWAITSFINEYEKKKQYIDKNYLEYIEPIYNRFKEFDFDLLPKSFIHGDIILTNTMKDTNNEFWVVDFSVSNYTARLIEIVVSASNFALIEGNKQETERRMRLMFERWSKNVNATDLEKNAFELLFRVQNAIYILNPSYQIAIGNDSNENKNYLELGKFGLLLDVDMSKNIKKI